MMILPLSIDILSIFKDFKRWFEKHFYLELPTKYTKEIIIWVSHLDNLLE